MREKHQKKRNKGVSVRLPGERPVMLHTGDPTERSSHTGKQASKQQARHAPSQAPHSPNLVILAASQARIHVARSAASATAALDWARGDRSAAATAINKQAAEEKTARNKQNVTRLARASRLRRKGT